MPKQVYKNSNSIGHNIRELRIKKGLTQRELAKLLGCAQTTVAGWESLERLPRKNSLVKLTEILKVTLDYLLNMELSQTPTHYAISLSGEPTMYPHLDEMVKYLKTLKATKSVFIVTNAQIPEFFEKLIEDEKAQPTQLYISLEAPNKELFDKINLSLYKDGWDRLHKSLGYFAKLKTRKVIRMTLIKGLNDKEEYFKEYAKQIELSKTDLIEIKGYVHIGMSNKRHKKTDMPTFEEIEDFSKKLLKELGNYTYIGEAINSRITLLKRNDSPYDVRIETL